MERSIIALLNQNLRVIIPDFGAFIIRQKEPRIVVFNEFLRYNDGLLIDFIVKSEGIDRDIAEQRVLDYADDNSRLLESGKLLVIPGLGNLQKDSSGKVNFSPEEEIPETPSPAEAAKPDLPEQESSGMQETAPVEPRPGPKRTRKQPVKKASTQAKGKTKKEPAPQPEEQSQEQSEKQQEFIANQPEPEEHQQEPEVRPTEAEEMQPEPEMKEPESEEEVPEPGMQQAEPEEKEQEPEVKQPEPEIEKQIAVETPVAMAEPPQPVEISESGDVEWPVRTGKNRANQILTWVLVILLANAAVLSWFVFRNDILGLFHKKKPVTMISDSVFNRLSDSVKAAAADTTLVYRNVEPVNEPVQETAKADRGSTPSGLRYYVVAGCFSSEANADREVITLKKQGFEAEKFGKIGNLYAVCFASYTNKEEAVKGLRKIREKFPQAWMTRF